MPKPSKLTRKSTTTTKRKTNNNKSLKQSNLNFLSWKILVPALILFAAVGGYYVYSTSATTRWRSVERVTSNFTGSGGTDGSGRHTTGTRTIKLYKGKTYRFCVRGYSTAKSNISTRLYFIVTSPNFRKDVAPSNKTYGKSSQLHCSKEFYASKDHRASGNIMFTSAALKIEAISIDERY